MPILLNSFLSIISSVYFVFMFYLSDSAAVLFKEHVVIGCAILFLVLFFIIYLIIRKFFVKNKINLIGIVNVIFIFILSIGLFGSLIGLNIVHDISEKENRVMNKFPQRNPFHEKFPGEFNSFIDDRIGLKNEAFTFYFKIRPFMLDNFNIKNKALIGKNNWLFYNEENDTVKNFQGVKDFNEKELSDLVLHIDKVYDFCKDYNIKFIFMMAPSKSSIYPEFYPDFIKRLDKPSSYERIDEYLKKHSKAPVASVFDAVYSKKHEYDLLFYKEDTHWNSVGAYFAYHKLASVIKSFFPDFRVVETEDLYRCDTENASHDLVNMIGGTLYDYPPTNEFCVKDSVTLDIVQAVDSHQPGYSLTSNKNGLKVMIFHDSFLLSMENFLNQGFSEKLNVWLYRISPLAYKKIILDYAPDLLIWEMQERYAPDAMRGGMKYDEADNIKINYKK